MKEIDLEHWNRREHYQFFSSMDYPQYNISFHVDVTNLRKVLKQEGWSFYHSMIYLSTQAANLVEEFRYRKRGEKVVLHDKLTPSYTDMKADENLFKFITPIMPDDMESFIKIAKDKREQQKEYFPLAELEGRDDFLYMTSIPWISFNHISHTINFNKNDSVPRLSWGKFFKEGSKWLLPYSVQANHAFVDGVHMGQFLENLNMVIQSCVSSLEGL